MKNLIWHCLHLATILLCTAGLSSGHLAAATQDGTRSHRRLELPQNSPTQPEEQLARLLQYFQSLKGEAPSAKGPNSTAADTPTLDQLKQALGPELGGMLDQLPPKTIQDVMKDPAIRNQVKEMLQQFSKDGKLPDFGTQPSKNGSQRNSVPGKQNLPNNTGGENRQRTGRDSNQLRPPPSSDRRPGTPDDSLENAQDRLSDLIEQLRQRQTLPNGDAAPSQNQQNETDSEILGSNSNPNQRPTQETNDNQPEDKNRKPPMTQTEWEERLRQLMQKQRDSVRKTPIDQSSPNLPSVPGTNSLSPSQRDGNRRQTSQGFDNSNRSNKSLDPARTSSQQSPDLSIPSPNENGRANNRGNNSTQRREEPTGATSPAPSMSEFLEQMRDVPAPDLSDLGVDLSAARQGNQNGSQGKMSGNLLADAMNQMDPQQLREQAKKALQDKGLRSTLKDILKDAKESAKQDVASAGGPGDIIADVAAATGMEDTVLEALGGMTEELVEIAKDAKFQSATPKGGSAESKPDGQQPSKSGPPATNTNDAPGSQQDKSVFSQFTESASNAISNFSQNSEPPADSGSSGPDLGSGSFSTLFFALILIVALIGCLLVGTKLMPASEVQNPEQVLATLLQQGIRSKEDVIKAFHQFALKPPHETQNWWTHARVVETVVHQYPQHSTRIQILASLYEQARYFPADTEFTDAQIRQAADAVRTVGVA